MINLLAFLTFMLAALYLCWRVIVAGFEAVSYPAYLISPTDIGRSLGGPGCRRR